MVPLIIGLVLSVILVVFNVVVLNEGVPSFRCLDDVAVICYQVPALFLI